MTLAAGVARVSFSKSQSGREGPGCREEEGSRRPRRKRGLRRELVGYWLFLAASIALPMKAQASSLYGFLKLEGQFC